jgi:hypothetical protein
MPERLYGNTTVNSTIRGTPFYAHSTENVSCNVCQLSSTSFTVRQPITINSRLQEIRHWWWSRRHLPEDTGLYAPLWWLRSMSMFGLFSTCHFHSLYEEKPPHRWPFPVPLSLPLPFPLPLLPVLLACGWSGKSATAPSYYKHTNTLYVNRIYSHFDVYAYFIRILISISDLSWPFVFKTGDQNFKRGIISKIYIQSNLVITSWKGLNILCRYKRVLL